MSKRKKKSILQFNKVISRTITVVFEKLDSKQTLRVAAHSLQDLEYLGITVRMSIPAFVKEHKRRPWRYSASLTDTSRWCRIKTECDGLNADWLCLLVFCLPLLFISVSALNKGKEVNLCADLNVQTYKQQMLCMKFIPQSHAAVSFLQQSAVDPAVFV